MTTPAQRAAHAAYMREWNQRDRERKLVDRRARYDEHREHINEMRRRLRPKAEPREPRTPRIRATYLTPEERFWAKVDAGDSPTKCMVWTGARTGRRGEEYGNTRWAGRGRMAHRVAYELLVGPIPVGLTLDHLCRNHLCVNPAHLEPVTNRENILRGNGITARAARMTHCVNGHAFDAHRRGRRVCRTCDRVRAREGWRRRNGYYERRQSGWVKAAA